MKLEIAICLYGLVAGTSLAVVAFARGALEPGDAGTQPNDPAPGFIAQMDQAPPDKRPPNWDQVKRLMARKAPAVGDPAPDFTLPTQDGKDHITRSTYQPGRAQVLVFGSFT